jgi:K+-sensing histidine kinase KdpD
MNWSNWIYLGAGLALGAGFRWFFARTKTQDGASVLAPVNQQDVLQLLEKIKQAQLAYHMAREMSQFKAGFLARTTHELRSPLNGLIGLHQLILSDLCENPEEEREFIAQAHERALKLLKLIDEILNVARIEHGTNKLDIQPQSLTEVLQEVYNLTYMLAANRNFRFQLLAPDDAEIYVLADPRWLRQVLLDLVDTTITQMEEGSICISAQASHTSDRVDIWLDVPNHTVTSSEPIDLIKFEKSKNAVRQTDKEKTGLSPGMKLLLNQTLLEVMGGKLEIVSSPTARESGENLTRVQVSIPRVIPETEFQQMEGYPG